MLNDQRSADARRTNPEERKAVARRVMGEMLEGVPVLREESPSGPTLSSSQTADRDSLLHDENAAGDRMVTVRLEDLCTIADSVATLVGDLDNGKYKYVGIDLEPLHEVVERWGADASVLGGGCHDDHRCRLCGDAGRYRPLA